MGLFSRVMLRIYIYMRLDQDWLKKVESSPPLNVFLHPFFLYIKLQLQALHA